MVLTLSSRAPAGSALVLLEGGLLLLLLVLAACVDKGGWTLLHHIPLSIILSCSNTGLPLLALLVHAMCAQHSCLTKQHLNHAQQQQTAAVLL
jgi:hypothetical protein